VFEEIDNILKGFAVPIPKVLLRQRQIGRGVHQPLLEGAVRIGKQKWRLGPEKAVALLSCHDGFFAIRTREKTDGKNSLKAGL
jgi:hypothetical protein